MARKPAGKPVMWNVYMMRARRMLIGVVHAGTEKEALQRAYDEHKIPKESRFKVSVERFRSE
jgi:hypothetical protein